MTDHTPSGLPQPQTVAALREAYRPNALDQVWTEHHSRNYPQKAATIINAARELILSAPAVETVAVQEAAAPNLKAIIAHWNEFGPEHGFGQLMDLVQDAPPYRRASTPPEKDSHGNEPRNGAGDQSPEKDASPDAGRVGGTLRNGANEHHEHRAGQPDPDRADDQRHCEGVGLPRESEVREGVAAPLPVAPKAEPLTLPNRVAELIEQHGSLRAAARVLDCDPGYLSRLQSGEKNDPGDTLLRRMGLRQITTYERIKT